MADLTKITALAKRLIRSGHYKISDHVLQDHPERKITAVDVLECIKIGSAVALEPREENGTVLYEGQDRYRWFGEDAGDRVLRLIMVVTRNVVVVSAAQATPPQTARYREEDEK